ncbi:T9SS type A sorting domain-containing protein, partial [bacterium]|nr:T9SS type A sorting domain-containing protein [bacterium]
VPNSAVWAEMVKGILLNDLPFGWGYSMALTSIESYLNNIPPSLQWYKTNVNDFGDPGLQPWRGVPTIVEAEFPETITPETKVIEVHVTDAENRNDMIGARVTLYSPGDMPEFSDRDYADYDEMVMLTKLTDSEGKVRFVFDPDEIPVFDHRYDLFLTITGRSICPLHETIDVERDLAAIGLADYSITDGNGNDVDEIHPGATVLLELTAINMGSDDVFDNVHAEAISLSPWIQIQDDEVYFGDIDPGEEVTSDETVTLIVSSVCPDGESRPLTRPDLKIMFISGDDTWFSMIRLNPSAPNFEVQRIIGGNIIDYDEQDLNIEIVNAGGMSARNIRARLMTVTNDLGASVRGSEARYPDLDPEEFSVINGDQFVVSGNSFVPPGYMSELMVILTCNNDFIDTAYFELQIDEPRENAPSPPDPYGYLCYDDTDEDWEIAPVYEWIEISETDDDPMFEGTLIEFEGDSPLDQGEAMVIDLGFTSRLYGKSFDQITVTTHGYICIGDQEGVVNYQNWPLDRGQCGGVGMIAPFWEDLRFRNDDAGIYYYYDEEDSRMIVEWYKVSHRGNNTELIFQVIIYDADVWVVDERRNPPLKFQYKEIENNSSTRGTAWDLNIPYASVGISSPDGYGIGYTYNNRYPDWAARLEDHRAIMFTTTPRFKSGNIEGYVTDYETDLPIQEAAVFTEHGFFDLTDEDGYYYIEDALAEIVFDITASKHGYNDSTYIDTFLIENETIRIDFALLHPEFDASDAHLRMQLDPEITVVLPFNIRNDGNGPLDWTLVRRLPGGAERDPWERRLTYDAGVTVEDIRLEGVIFINERFYISGANMWDRQDGPNMIYVLNRDGELISEFEQPGESRYGIRDLAWDGELIWGSGADSVYGFTPDGELDRSFEGPYDTNSPITWDSHREVLWVAGRVSNEIVAYDTSGNEVDRIPRFNLRMYAFAYYHDDPDEYPLYVFTCPDNLTQLVYKIDPIGVDTMFVAELETEEGGTPGGAFATNTFDVYSWVFIGIANHGGEDRIDIWQIDARRDWFRVFTNDDEERIEIYDGVIDAGVEHDFELQLSSIDLPEETFQAMLVYYHNAEGGEAVIDVTLDVIDARRQSDFGLLEPSDNDTLDSNIMMDTEVTFKWEESIDPNINDVVTYEVLFESCGEQAMVASETCSLIVDIADMAEEMGLSIEVEFPMFWSVRSISGDDIVPCERRFSFMFLPHGIYDPDGAIPVEFGLHSIYPSPFNSMTTIRFGVDRPERFMLRVYDLSGRLVRILYDSSPVVGYRNIVWDAGALPSGVYLLHLESGGRSQVRKVALVR